MGAGVAPGVGVVVGVGDGVGVACPGMVVEVIWKTATSGDGESVCARAESVAAPKTAASATRAAHARYRRKACFTKNPPDGSI